MWQAGVTLHRGARASHYRSLSLRSTGSRRAGSVVVAHGPSCSAACGIFPDQGSNPCTLHWQADSQPLRHQGSPTEGFLSLMQVMFQLHSFAGRYSVSQQHLLKRLSFPHCVVLASLSKISWHTCRGLFLNVLFCFICSFFKKIYVFIWGLRRVFVVACGIFIATCLVVACGIFSCGMHTS